MADRTGIEWTDATWNPVRGCSRVSAGCQHCYAERVAARFSGPGQPYEGLIHPSTGGWNGKVRLVPEALQIPWRWTRPRRIFVNSMSDLFHPEVPFEFIAAVFWIMSVTTRHTYQILTKRPERALEFFKWLAVYGDEDAREHGEFMMAASRFIGRDQFTNLEWNMGDAVYAAAHTIPEIAALPWEPARAGRGGYDNCGPGWPLVNVWLGVSVEDQAAADERIPLLLQCPAAVRWISAEPLLGPVNLTDISEGHAWREVPREYWSEFDDEDSPPGMRWDALGGIKYQRFGDYQERSERIAWVVAGGESGPGARPMHPGWARSLRDQCAATGVPFLFKQWGAWRSIDQGDRDWYDSLYRARVRAREGQSQAELDDIYGRECTVDTAVIQNNGVIRSPTDPGAWEQGTESFLTFRVGKKAAGRELDGVLHDGYPEVRHG